MLKWELFERYVTQGSRNREVTERFNKREQEAEQRVRELQSEMEAILRREFSEGVDLLTEKESTRESIAQAEQVYESAQQEAKKAREFVLEKNRKDKITPHDLGVDWNTNYRQQVRKAEFKPIDDRMKAARADYLNAIADWYELNRKYGMKVSEVRELVKHAPALKDESTGYKVSKQHPHDIATKEDLTLITAEDVANLHYGKFPTDVVRKSTLKGAV